MAYNNRRHPSAVSEAFTLSPLPYPALLILLLVLLLLGASSFFSFQDFMEELGEQLRWGLLAVPVIIILAVQWLPSVGSFEDFVYDVWPHDRRRRRYRYDRPSTEEATSPWTMAAVLVVLLVLAYFQSGFHEMWGP